MEARGKVLALAACSLAALVFVAAGCGGGSSDDGSDEDETTAAETTAAETGAPADTGAAADTDAAAPSREGLRIGEVFYAVDPFQVALEKWAKHWADEAGFELLTCNQEAQAQPGINCIQDWIAQGVDGIIYAPTDPAAAVAPVEDAQAAGIPIEAVVIKPNPPAQMPFATVDEKGQTFEAGVQAATMAQELFPGQPLGVLALDLLNLPICKESRMGGFIEGVKSVDPEATIYDIDGKGDRLGATNVTTDFIQSGREFNIVSACTGEMLQGALSALKAAGRGEAVDKKPQTEYVFAIDGDKTQLQQLLDPTSPVMQAMGSQPKEQAKKQIDLLFEMIDGTIPLTSDKTIPLPGKLIDPNCDEVNEYLTSEYLEDPLPC